MNNVKIKILEVKKTNGGSEMVVGQILSDDGKPLAGTSIAVAMPKGSGLMDIDVDKVHFLTLTEVPPPSSAS